MSSLTRLAIRGRFIELYKILKLVDLAESGGEAKQLIAAGRVLVNGSVETRKRRKVRPGETISCLGREVRITGSPES